MKDLKKLTPFKYFVLTNFPFIEEDFDALTNYQLFCKISEYINNVAATQNDTTDNFNELLANWNAYSAALTAEWNAYSAALTAEWNEYKDYFDNLDVQEEINNKLDDMVQDGTFLEIIEGTVTNAASRTADGWLNSHIQEISGYVLDSSLTLNNAAAPAGTVGEKIAELNDALDALATFETVFGKNKVDTDTITLISGTVGSTRNFSANVYLEKDKEYRFQIWNSTANEYSILTSSEVTIRDATDTTTLLTVVNWEAIPTGGTTFTWTGDNGLYKIHLLVASGFSVANEIFNGLFIYYNSLYPSAYEVGEDEFKGTAKNSKLFDGHSIDEFILNPKYPNISCVGDSLTQGAGAPAYNYVNQLNSDFLQNQLAYRFGVGGEGSLAVAYRQGGIPVYVMPNTIPADTTPLEIELKNSMGSKVQYGAINGLLFGVSNCKINGVKGTLTVSEDKTHTYFTRDTSGDAVTFDRPVLFVSEIMEDHLNDTFIIWVGTNDNISTNGTEPTFNHIDDMINIIEHDRYIIVGMTTQAYMANIDEINTAFMNKYGSHFVNVRKYLELYGLADNNLSDDSHETYNDTAIPDALYADGVHFNRYGYYSIAKCIYLFGKDKGYFR